MIRLIWDIRRLVSAINAFEGSHGHRRVRWSSGPAARSVAGRRLVCDVQLYSGLTRAGLRWVPGLGDQPGLPAGWAPGCYYRRSRLRPTLMRFGQSLQFAIEGSAGANATVLATWLNRLRVECYVAPWSGQVTNGTTGRSARGVLQGGWT